MPVGLELLAPARNLDIGIAAVDCGADAVYIAGPAFGARVAAANSVEDVRNLCGYAHRFGVKVFATLNTLLEREEYCKAENLINEYYQAGVDALIVQDLSLLKFNLPPMEIHASTQMAIRTPETAARLEKLGFTRLILERQLSLDQIKAIRSAVDCELEFFVHGALCVSYSGECYMSQEITGRSANRGCCAQPCRSKYDLVDADGKIILKDQPILSLKDLRLDDHIGQLASVGISSFKIEGRLKNDSYVKNIVRHYRNVLDRFISENPQYCRSSYGRLSGGFTPDPECTFNRGYTSCFIDGERGRWNSGDAAKSVGQFIGEVLTVEKGAITIDGQCPLSNGDGLSFVAKGEEMIGMRVDVAEGGRIVLKDSSSLAPGMKVYRNMNLKFEKELEKNMPKRLIGVSVHYQSFGGVTTVTAVAENGAEAVEEFRDDAPFAEKPENALDLLRRQLGKTSDIYSFTVEDINCDSVRFYSSSFLNGIRRSLAESLRSVPYSRKPAQVLHCSETPAQASTLTVKKELMRTRYCIRHELGFCPKQHPDISPKEPLTLRNQGRVFHLGFDCKNCEMVVTL